MTRQVACLKTGHACMRDVQNTELSFQLEVVQLLPRAQYVGPVGDP